MSLATEMTRLRDARDKIRNKLIGIELNKEIVTDVLETAELGAESIAPESDGGYAHFGKDGYGDNYCVGAIVTVTTTVKKGTYSILYAGDNCTEVSLRVANGASHDTSLGTLFGILYDESSAPDPRIVTYEDLISYGFVDGESLTFTFMMDMTGSDNHFKITLTHTAPALVNADSKLDDCADALKTFLAESTSMLDEV